MRVPPGRRISSTAVAVFLTRAGGQPGVGRTRPDLASGDKVTSANARSEPISTQADAVLGETRRVAATGGWCTAGLRADRT
jgi:hypothetical protein